MSEKRRLMLLGPAFLATLVYGSPALADEEPAEPESTATAPAETEESEGTKSARPVPADRSDKPENPPEESDGRDDSDAGDGQEADHFLIPQQPQDLPTTPTEETSGEMGTDERNAVRVVSEFWVRNWPKNFAGRYTPPTVRGPYDSTREWLKCGDSELRWVAFYCFPDDYIAWDKNFIKGIPREEGNTFPYLVVAHEWGHAIQKRTGPGWHWAASELQADCLAGATLFGASEEGRLVWEPQDPQKLGGALTRIADAHPWSEPEHHGDADERVAAFKMGEGGVKACAPQQP